MTMLATAVSRTGAGSERQSAAARLRQRIRAEFVEMPGLKLTPMQAARFLGLDAHQSTALLQDLIDDGFLARDARGAYLRRSLLADRAAAPWAHGV